MRLVREFDPDVLINFSGAEVPAHLNPFKSRIVDRSGLRWDPWGKGEVSFFLEVCPFLSRYWREFHQFLKKPTLEFWYADSSAAGDWKTCRVKWQVVSRLQLRSCEDFKIAPSFEYNDGVNDSERDFSDADKEFFKELVRDKQKLILLTEKHLEMDYIAASQYTREGGAILKDVEHLSWLTVIDCLGADFARFQHIWL